MIKMSIILFYRRIFGMSWALWFCIFLALGYWISVSIAFVLACSPPSYFWTQYSDPSSGFSRFPLYPFYIGNAAANVITDGIILLVPVPIVWRLQIKTIQKVMLCGVFLLGGLYVFLELPMRRNGFLTNFSYSVCVASIVRIHYMTYLHDSMDVTWIMGDVFVWSSVEPCIGIVCACLPTLQPLFRRALGAVWTTATRSSNNNSKGLTSSNMQSSKKRFKESDGRRFHYLDSVDGNRQTPRDDEAILGHTNGVEMDSLAGDGLSEKGSGGGNKSNGITVRHEFEWQVEPREGGSK